MISHEEARKKANEMTFPYSMFFEDYISQQEKKDKLIALYRKAHIDVLNGDLAKQIEVIEEELK